MKVVGLITEYNPFHNGHQYHILEAKRITGADYVVVVMSGNFVQRGGPAFMDKYSRTEMALACGADLVFELPVCYSTASAELFALGSVSLLDKLGIIDYICFGSECGNINDLTSLAQILLKEPPEYKILLNKSLKSGKTFPAARLEAIKTLSSDSLSSILSSPNNILGIEYIKALIKLKSNLKPVTITRVTADYHSQELTTFMGSTISSATAIRKTLKEDKSLANLKDHVPESVFNILKKQSYKTFPIYEDDYSLLLHYKLMMETKLSLRGYGDVTTDLANRIHDNCNKKLSFSELSSAIKSKQWTLTRINRVLTHILLNLYSHQFNTYQKNGYTQYARILGIKKESSHLIRTIVKNEKIPVITKVGNASKQLTPTGFTMLQEDMFATHLYNLVVYEKYGIQIKDEYTHGIILYDK